MQKTFIASVFAGCVSAWWDQGHLLTARRAYDLLQVENPAAYTAAVDMLAYLKRHYPDITESEGSHPFVECATFADVIKGLGYKWQSGWHFIDQPYVDQEGKTIADYPGFVADVEDNVQALYALTNFLTQTGDYTATTYYQQIAEAFPLLADQQSFALRLIIHYVGDIHQPLHTSALVNDHYPHGDSGGNYEHMSPVVDGVSTLHSVWDSVGYQYTGYSDLPFDAASWTDNGAKVDSIVPNYPVNVADIHDGNFEEWAAEGYTNSVDSVYATFADGQKEVDQTYKDMTEALCKSRIMYGGRRLADLMISIFGKTPESAALM